VLAAFDRLALALTVAGARLVGKSGLGRVLDWIRRTHGELVGLVAGPRRLSPAMAFGARAPPR